MMCIIQLNNKAAALIISCKPKESLQCLYHSLLETFDLALNVSKQKPVAPTFSVLDRKEQANDPGKTTICDAVALECDEGMYTYHDPLFIYTAKNPPDISDEAVRSTVLYNLGIAHMHLGDDKEAFTYFSFLIDLRRAAKKSEPNPSICKNDFSGASMVAVLSNIGHIHFRAGKYEEALVSYKEVVEITRNCHGYYHLDVAAALNSIGVLRLHSLSSTEPKEVEVTLAFFTEAHAIRNALLGHDEDKHTATVMNNIGRAKFITGDYEAAYTYHSLSYDIRQMVLVSNHLDVAATLNNMAQASSMMKNSKRALSLYEEYLDIATEKLGMKHIDIAATVRNMAEIHEDAGNLEEATQYYKQAVSLYQDVATDDVSVLVEVSSILNKIGNIYYEQDDLVDAIDAYQKGLEIDRQIYNEPNRNVATTLLNIAFVYKTQESSSDALAYYKEAAQIQHALGEPEALRLACTLSTIGLLLDDSGSYDAAILAYEKVLVLRTEHLGSCHFDVSTTLNAMGVIYYNQDLVEVAVKCFEVCLSIRRGSKDSTNDDMATVLFNLGSVHVDSGDSGEAIRCFTECITLEAKLENSLRTLKRLGRVYLERDEIKAALKCFNDGVQICKTSDDNAVKAQLSTFFTFVGKCHFALNQPKEAMAAICDGMRANREAGIEGAGNLIDFPVVDFYFLMSKIKLIQCAPAA
jgi:tetratricopeptide (TPR) repeat protein